MSSGPAWCRAAACEVSSSRKRLTVDRLLQRRSCGRPAWTSRRRPTTTSGSVGPTCHEEYQKQQLLQALSRCSRSRRGRVGARRQPGSAARPRQRRRRGQRQQRPLARRSTRRRRHYSRKVSTPSLMVVCRFCGCRGGSVCGGEYGFS